MNPVIEDLVDIVEADPLPIQHTSSYWQHYGNATVVERDDHGFKLHSVGIETVDRMIVPRRLLCMLERMSYREVTTQWRSYPSIWKTAKRLAIDISGGPNFNFNVFKSSCALALLADHWKVYGLSPKTFAVIGDGYGFLSSLIRRYCPGIRLYCIDLPKTLVFQSQTHYRANSKATMSVLSYRHASREADIIFVPAQDVELIPDQIDCAINVASMQEMNGFSIASYFTFLRQRSGRNSRFYCVNRLEKKLPGGEIVKFYDYPWQREDRLFIDGPCPYYTHFFDRHMHPAGPRVFGVRVPFVNYFEGLHMHRLAHLVPLAASSP